MSVFFRLAHRSFTNMKIGFTEIIVIFIVALIVIGDSVPG